jgi:hypothetical protein
MLKSLIETIKRGDAESVRMAKKHIGEIKKEYLESGEEKRREIKKGLEIFLYEMGEFHKIEKVDNQAHFLNVLSDIFLILNREHFDFFLVFVLLHIQNPSGKVRQALFNSSFWLLCEGYSCVSPSIWGNKKISDEEKELLEKNKLSYFDFLEELEFLMDEYCLPEYEKYEYIQDLPPSIYKSLEMLFFKATMPKEIKKEYKKYLKEKEKMTVESEKEENSMKKEISDAIMKNKNLTKEDILKRREEIKKELTEIIEKNKINYSFEDIEKMVYQKKIPKSLPNIIDIFSDCIDSDDKVLPLLNDLFNFFPHKELNGLSPVEKIKEYY